MKTLRICSLNKFPVYHIALLAVVTILCIIFLVLTYLITRSLYLLTTFLQYSFPPPSASGNRKSDLFLYGFVCFLDSTY